MTARRDDITIACEDADDLADRVADWLVGELGRTPGRASVALSGGSTPRRLYERLARDPWRRALPWERVHWFWGDERFVAADDARSNQKMVREAMLDHVPVQPENIHAVPVCLPDPRACADAYAADLLHYYGAPALVEGRPLFDVVLLGIGPDGHTASLFPGSTALDDRTTLTAACAAGLEPFVSRVTLTFPAIASSRSVAFLVSGADKAQTLARIKAGEDLPAGHVTSSSPVRWFADRAALGLD